MIKMVKGGKNKMNEKESRLVKKSKINFSRNLAFAISLVTFYAPSSTESDEKDIIDGTGNVTGKVIGGAVYSFDTNSKKRLKYERML